MTQREPGYFDASLFPLCCERSRFVDFRPSSVKMAMFPRRQVLIELSSRRFCCGQAWAERHCKFFTVPLLGAIY